MSPGTSPSPTSSPTPIYTSRRRVQVARWKGRPAERKPRRSSRPLVHLHPTRFRNLRTNQRQGTKFLQELGCRLRTIGDDPRESAFLRQRISITLHRFNATAFSDTFTTASETEFEAYPLQTLFLTLVFTLRIFTIEGTKKNYKKLFKIFY